MRAYGTRWIRWIWAIGFAEGACMHVWYLVQGGLHAFRGEPIVIQLFFHAELLLDPLVLLLMLRRSRAAAWLGPAVLLCDTVAFWWLCWDDLLRHPAAYLKLTGLPAVTVFGLFVLITAVPLHRAYAARRVPLID
ncbi:hypothetical protein DN069_26995 [Streptacidiphilus pinicola]|uniref:Uncharacterized protein n=1 Tax=Streptacidiphilus pinicola TaxID=2219663 RepID=A0A2X0JZV6_9ACTN|nr:hypothetical protein [Streptacidiphilus pinicola]RAG82505.1 hypothetical protein DN069_26995 [Streptacidiphilus pinicola]